MRDGISNVQPVVAIAPVVVTDNTAQVSAIINTADFNKLSFFILLGTLADADATGTVLVQHGNAANLSDAADVPDHMLVGTELLAGFNFADDGETRKIGYIGDRQYVRVTVTPANNTGALPIAVLALLEDPRVAPTANPPQ